MADNEEGRDTQDRPSTINDNPNTVRPGGENEGVANNDGGEGAETPTGDESNDSTSGSEDNSGEGSSEE